MFAIMGVLRMGVRMVDGCEGGGEENGGHEDSDKGDEEGGAGVKISYF